MEIVTNKHDYSKLSQCHINTVYQEGVVNSFSVFLEILSFEILVHGGNLVL